MKNNLDEIKLKSIMKQLEVEDTDLVSKTLAEVVCMLNEEELAYIKSHIKNINSKHKLEILFVMQNLDDLRKDIANNTKNKDELELLFKEMFTIKREYIDEDDDLNFINSINFEEVLHKYSNDEEVKYAKDLIKEIVEKGYSLYKVASFLLCGLDDYELMRVSIWLEHLMSMSKKASKDNFVDNLSEQDKNKLLKGEAIAREAKFNLNTLPKNIQKEFLELLKNSFDPKTGVLKIDSSNTSKELLEFLEKNSKDIFNK